MGSDWVRSCLSQDLACTFCFCQSFFTLYRLVQDDTRRHKSPVARQQIQKFRWQSIYFICKTTQENSDSTDANDDVSFQFKSTCECLRPNERSDPSTEAVPHKIRHQVVPGDWQCSRKRLLAANTPEGRTPELRLPLTHKTNLRKSKLAFRERRHFEGYLGPFKGVTFWYRSQIPLLPPAEAHTSSENSTWLFWPILTFTRGRVLPNMCYTVVQYVEYACGDRYATKRQKVCP